MAIQGYPVALDANSVPYVNTVPWATSDQSANASQYRTLTGESIDAAVQGDLPSGGQFGASTVSLTVAYAILYLESRYGTPGGQLIDMSSGQPALAAVGAAGDAVQFDAQSVPFVDVADGPMTVPADASLLWITRNFGKR